jgi:hypothetical protein
VKREKIKVMNEPYSLCFAGLALLVYSQRTLGGVITRENMTRLYDALQFLIRNRVAGFSVGVGLGVACGSSSVPVLLLMTFVDKGGLSLSQGFAVFLGAMAGAPFGVFWPEVFSMYRGVFLLLIAAVGIMVTPRRKRPYFDVIFCCGLLLFGYHLLVKGLSGSGVLANAVHSVSGGDPLSLWFNLSLYPKAFEIGLLSQSSISVHSLLAELVRKGLMPISAAGHVAVVAPIGLCVIPGLVSYFLLGSQGRRIAFGFFITTLSCSLASLLFYRSLISLVTIGEAALGIASNPFVTLHHVYAVGHLFSALIWLPFIGSLLGWTRVFQRAETERRIAVPDQLVEALPQYSKEFLREFLYRIEKTSRLAKFLFDSLLLGGEVGLEEAPVLRRQLGRETASLLMTGRRLSKIVDGDENMKGVLDALFPFVVRLDIAVREMEAVEQIVRTEYGGIASQRLGDQSWIEFLHQQWEDLYSEIMHAASQASAGSASEDLAIHYFDQVALGIQAAVATYGSRERGEA